MVSSSLIKNVAIVIGSTRNTARLGPHIAGYVQGRLQQQLDSSDSSNKIRLDVLDLADQKLPLFDEPTIPIMHPADDPTPHYGQAHSRAWSAKVREYDGFVIVTSQHNWSIPASVKNALDYLYHEWVGKPVAVVSYGGHGGGQAAGHLRAVLGGLRMKTAETGVELTVPREVMGALATGGVDMDVLAQAWKASGDEERLSALGTELVQALGV